MMTFKVRRIDTDRSRFVEPRFRAWLRGELWSAEGRSEAEAIGYVVLRLYEMGRIDLPEFEADIERVSAGGAA